MDEHVYNPGVCSDAGIRVSEYSSEKGNTTDEYEGKNT